MKTKFFIRVLLISALVISCSREQIPQTVSITEISARFEGSGSKTVISPEDSTLVFWSPKDEISVFYGSSSAKFISTNTVPEGATIFTSQSSLILGSTEGIEAWIWAAYPYNEDNVCDGDGVTVTVPYYQTAVSGSFEKGSFVSVARSYTTQMAFYNVCGGIRLKFSQSGIAAVGITANGGETLAGRVKVGFNESGVPQVTSVLSGSEFIGLSLPSEEEEFECGEWYYVPMLPNVLSKGLTIILFKKSGEDVLQGEYEIPAGKEVVRSRFGSLSGIDKDLEFKLRPYWIDFDESDIEMTVQTSRKLSFKPFPENAEYDKLYWSSSDTSVAEVDNEGNVTAKSTGTAEIKASYSNFSYGVCKVTVYASEPSIVIDKSELKFTSESSSADVNLISNRDWAVSEESVPSWISVTPSSGTASSEACNVKVTAEKNSEMESRSAEIIFASKSKTLTLKVVQEGFQPEDKTVAEFINLADTQTYYKLKGIVSGFSTKYCSFDLTDDTGTIYVYSVVDSCKTKYSTVIKNGGTVTILGKYSYYSAKSQHEVVSAIITDFTPAKQEIIETEKIADVFSAAEADSIILNNATVIAAAKTSYLVTDAGGTDKLFVFHGAEHSIKVGDVVNVKAHKETYCSMMQLGTPTTEIVSSGTPVVWPSPEDITSTFDSFSSTTVKYVSFTGTLTQNGNYYNVTVNGASTNIGSILTFDGIDSLVGVENTTFEGYYVYTSGTKYINVMYTK